MHNENLEIAQHKLAQAEIDYNEYIAAHGFPTSATPEFTALRDDLSRYNSLVVALIPFSSLQDSSWKTQFGYSPLLKESLGMELPYEQYGLYLSTLYGSWILGRNVLKAWHVAEAVRHETGSDQRRLLKIAAGVTEEQLLDSAFLSRSLVKRGFILGIGVPVLFSACVFIKNLKKRIS